MFPWYFNWAPVVHYPWSGAVRQMIAPETDWFFNSIAPGGGNSRIEQRVFEEVASYGKQLGLITEVLLAAADESRLSEDGKKSLARLKEIAGRIEKIKHTSATPSTSASKTRCSRFATAIERASIRFCRRFKRIRGRGERDNRAAAREAS